MLRPTIVVLPRLSNGILRGRKTSLYNGVIIKVGGDYEMQAEGQRHIKMGFFPPAMDRYYFRPSVVFSFPKMPRHS